ncbi:hypothetical protein C0431_11975 [bacterium]|nr:hypothetical protein [bacterium]
MKFKNCKTSLIIAAMCCCALAQAQTTYRMTELGPAQGLTAGSTFGLNNNGQIGFGGAYILEGNTGSFTTIPLIPGNTRQPTGTALNALGNAAATIRTGTTAATTRGAFFNRTTNTTIQLADLGGQTSTFAINESNTIVGSSRTTTSSGSETAVLWNSGGIVNLATTGFVSGQASRAVAINNSNLIVGVGRLTGDTSNQALVFNGSGGASRLSLLSGTDRGEARGLNNTGMIIGVSSNLTADTRRATLWMNSSSTGVELLRPTGFTSSSVANDINELGIVVGNSSPDGSETRAVVWENGIGYDLNTLLVNPDSSVLLRIGEAINDQGWIVATGFNANQELRAYLLTPEAVPEPFTMAGLAALALLRRRKANRQNKTSS